MHPFLRHATGVPDNYQESHGNGRPVVSSLYIGDMAIRVWVRAYPESAAAKMVGMFWLACGPRTRIQPYLLVKD